MHICAYLRCPDLSTANFRVCPFLVGDSLIGNIVEASSFMGAWMQTSFVVCMLGKHSMGTPNDTISHWFLLNLLVYILHTLKDIERMFEVYVDIKHTRMDR